MKMEKKPLPSKHVFSHPKALLNQVRRIAIAAGEVTLDYFDEGGYSGADLKGDGSPVTLADQKAEDLIKAKLLEIAPETPFLGEESVASGEHPDFDVSDFYWCVDPLDGTKEFISGSGDYTVNIALIYKDRPVMGVVYAPVHGELYAGYTSLDGEQFALRWLEDTGSEKMIHTRRAPREGLTIVASKSHGSGEKLDAFLNEFKINKLAKRGSSLKICIVAAGKADIYPRFGPTCEWDTAAADAILRAAGGMITDTQNKPLSYRKKGGNYLNPEFIAWSGDLLPEEAAA